ncbi:MAG: response regulator [Elusimicrobia bacterium]|nr:response regulator [Elusimicrobiota bacterium]
MSPKPVRVLLVEDDAEYSQLVRLCLGEPAFEVDVGASLAEALRKLAASRYDAALVDLALPDARGLESVLAVLAAAPNMPLIVSTNLGDEKAALDAVRLGAQDFMIKANCDSRLFKRSIRYAIERKAVLVQRDEIIRAAADGLVVVDASGTVRFLNAAAEIFFGAKAAALLGRPFTRPVKPGDVSLVEFARPGGPSSVEMRVTAVSWNGEPACLACFHDVTDLLRRLESGRTAAARSA